VDSASNLKNTLVLEETRVQKAYAKRSKDKRYSWFDQGHLFFIQDRERKVLRLLEKHGLEDLSEKKILEIGCGNGYWLQEFLKWGAQAENLIGTDILPERLLQAKKYCSAGVTVEYANGLALPYADETFDVILQSTVFTSILDHTIKEKMAREMMRVLRRNGHIIWYDFHMNNPRNSDVKGIKMSEIEKLFPNCQSDLKRTTLAPPLYRMLAPISWGACYVLEQMKVFNSHYLGVITKNP